MKTLVYHRNCDRQLWLSLVFILAMMASASAVRADIYYWQDAQGVIHFSNQDAPPASTLYMREPHPVAAEPTARVAPVAPTSVQEQLEEKLERSHQKLERALEQVDALSDKINESQHAAAVAASEARKAAQEGKAVIQSSAREPAREVRRRVVYYPVAHDHVSASRFKHHKFKHNKFKHNKFKHHKFKRYQHKPHGSKVKPFKKWDRRRPGLPKTIRIHYKSRPSASHRAPLSRHTPYR